MIREAIMSAMLKKGAMSEPSSTPDSPETPDVYKIKNDWNDFLSWMDSKKMKGKPELDKGDLGNQYFRQYIKEHPQTSLSEKVIPIIRQEYIKLRDTNLQNIYEGKAQMQTPIGNVSGEAAKKYADNFMGFILLNEKSENPNYVGQRLTMTPFPGAKIKSEEGEVIEEYKTYTPEQSKMITTQKDTKVSKIPSKNTPIKALQKQ